MSRQKAEKMEIYGSPESVVIEVSSLQIEIDAEAKTLEIIKRQTDIPITWDVGEEGFVVDFDRKAFTEAVAEIVRELTALMEVVL